jgi:hypothetical protein
LTARKKAKDAQKAASENSSLLHGSADEKGKRSTDNDKSLAGCAKGVDLDARAIPGSRILSRKRPRALGRFFFGCWVSILAFIRPRIALVLAF